MTELIAYHDLDVETEERKWSWTDRGIAFVAIVAFGVSLGYMLAGSEEQDPLQNPAVEDVNYLGVK